MFDRERQSEKRSWYKGCHCGSKATKYTVMYTLVYAIIYATMILLCMTSCIGQSFKTEQRWEFWGTAEAWKHNSAIVVYVYIYIYTYILYIRIYAYIIKYLFIYKHIIQYIFLYEYTIVLVYIIVHITCIVCVRCLNYDYPWGALLSETRNPSFLQIPCHPEISVGLTLTALTFPSLKPSASLHPKP